MHQWFRESKIQVVIYATTEGPRGKFKLLCKGKRGEKMASSREKSLATIQEAQITVTEVLGRLRFDTATFRGWNKVQATGRHFSQYKCRKNDLNWQEVLLTLGRTRKFIPPPWYKGGRGRGVDGTQRRIFDMLQYFETILPSVKSL